MNNKDRKRIGLLMNYIDAVPLPHNGHGAKTASVLGAVAYAQDMRELQPHLRDAMRGIIGVEGYDADDSLNKIKEYIAKRKQEGWKSR